MDILKNLLLISRLGLLVAGIIFLGLTLFCDYGTWTLIAALGCVALANLMLFIRLPFKENKK